MGGRRRSSGNSHSSRLRQAAAWCLLVLIAWAQIAAHGSSGPPGAAASPSAAKRPPSSDSLDASFGSARFLVGFRHYASATRHEQTLRALWSTLPALADDADASIGSSVMADDALRRCSARVNESLSCAASAWPTGALTWRMVERSNPAAHLPTDFLVLQFERDTQAYGPAHGAEASELVRVRAAAQLRALVASHPDVLKYAQEDVRVSRSLLHVAEEAPLSEAEVAEQQALREELSDIERRIEQVKKQAAAPLTTADSTRPLAGGVGDFPAPQRFDLSRHAARAAAAESELSSLSTTGASIRRKLCQWGGGSGNLVAEQLQASKLWKRGFSGAGIRIAIFDTGLSATHSHFRNVDERTNWTDEQTLEDGLGHGTFVAGVISSARECLGFAPDARLHVFRVFNQRQLSFTSWFLDAFNYAIHSKVNVLNLSIGGPDFLDRPFVDKVNEMSANGITVVSAIGNDGPLWGTLNNPADQMDVIGVGGINEDERISPFSSRGMTTAELPNGYGRMKPDLVALARNIRGSQQGSGCKTMSGTSVASPVVAGCVTLLASVVPESERAAKLNPAFLKQLLLESSERVGSGSDVPGIFEQGEGKISLLRAFDLLTSTDTPFVPHASLVPSKLDLTDCPYMWPYCTQPLYFSALPVLVNMTLLNSQAVSSFLPADAPPRFYLTSTDDAAQDLLHVWFTYPDSFWPWSGYFAVHLALHRDIDAPIVIEGFISLTLQTDDEFSTRSVIRLPLRVSAVPAPPRSKRLLFDSFHNLRYPSGYFPRDNLEVKVDTLDWNGDHVHTNYREIYGVLREAGYFIEVLGRDWTCVDASLYGALLLWDPEEEYFSEEVLKLHDDVYLEGLNLFVLGDWYNTHVMHEIKFYDENTAEWWSPETGGSNVPALNHVLAGFGMQLSDHVVKADIHIGEEHFAYASGTTISKFPQGGMLSFHRLSDGGSGASQREYAILGAYSPSAPESPLASAYPNAGRVLVYGDSNCIDMNHRRGSLCGQFIVSALDYLTTGAQSPRLFKADAWLQKPYVDATVTRKPTRVQGNNLVKYSKVISPGSRPACPVLGPRATTEEEEARSTVAADVPLSYSAQHKALRREALGEAASTRVHPLSKLTKDRRTRRAPSPDSLDPSHGAASSAALNEEGAGLSPDHVLAKHARLDPDGRPLESNAGDFTRSSRLSSRSLRSTRAMWLWLCLALVVLSIAGLAWLWLRQRRAHAERQAQGKHSPTSTPRGISQNTAYSPVPFASGTHALRNLPQL